MGERTMGLHSTRVALSVACLLGITSVQAQEVAIAPINNWSYTRHSSTATEGFLRGSAALVQANAQKNYLDSIALVNLQEAQRRAIENRKLYVQTYLANKEAIREHRQKYAPVPPTAEQWARVQEMANPDRLTEQQFDPNTGAVVWPHILRQEEYSAMRLRIDQLLSERTPETIGDGSPNQREISTLIDGMARILKSNISNVTAGQFGAANAFLKSLDFEMRFPQDAGSGRTGDTIANNVQ